VQNSVVTVAGTPARRRRLVEKTSHARAQSAALPLEQRMRNKLLLIDDDPVITAIYRDHFRAAGFQVEAAADGADGLVAFETFKPDVVLLDLNMPRLNGVEWLTAIRSAGSRQVPVVVLTSGAPEWQLNVAQDSDAVYVLRKDTADPRIVVEAVITAIDTFATS
jgi:CheY-like chemotaxis protein